MSNITARTPLHQHYTGALTEAKKELTQTIAELGEAQNKALELEQRIADLRQTISVLSKLCGEEDIDVEESLGLTDAIRLAFVSAGNQAITAQEMRLRLESQGFNTRQYGNLLASIHTVIKRLEAKGEIQHAPTTPRFAGGGDQKPAYIATPLGKSVVAGKAIGMLVKEFVPKILPKPK